MAYGSERQFRVSVEGIPGYWSTTSGGDISVDVTEVFDGAEEKAFKFAGPQKIAPVMLKRPSDPEKQTWVPAFKKAVGKKKYTIVRVPIDADGIPVGTPEIWMRALLTKFNPPDFDAASNNTSTLEAEFAPEDFE